MIRKLGCAVAVLMVAVGFVMADVELTGVITKVDGNNITFQKTKKGGGKKKAENDGDPIVINAKGATVVTGKFDKDTKKFVDGDPVTGGLTAVGERVTKAGDKGVGARVTVSDDLKKASKISVQGSKKKKNAAE